jgi:hypothetical protein
LEGASRIGEITLTVLRRDRGNQVVLGVNEISSNEAQIRGGQNFDAS